MFVLLKKKLLEPHAEGGLGGGSVAKIKLEIAKDFTSSLVTFLGYVDQGACTTEDVNLLDYGKCFCNRCRIFTVLLLLICLQNLF